MFLSYFLYLNTLFASFLPVHDAVMLAPLFLDCSFSSQIGDIANFEQIDTYVSGNGFTFDTIPISTKIISVVCETPDHFARIVKATDGTKWVFQVVNYNGTFAPNGTNCKLTYYYNR